MTRRWPCSPGGRPGRDQSRRRNRRTAAPPAGFVCVEHADVQGESAAAVLIGTRPSAAYTTTQVSPASRGS
jgi:hypothetical protein